MSPSLQSPYFANELAVHSELIGYSYSDEVDLRKQSFQSEMDKFTSIGRDLLNGNISSFRRLSRYYVHPSKYREYTREYMISQWRDHKTSIVHDSDLIGSHPSCPKYTADSDELKSFEIYFSHNCCTKYGPAHFDSAATTGGFDTVLHYEYPNISELFKARNRGVLEKWKTWNVTWCRVLAVETAPCDVFCYCDAGAWWNNSAVPSLEVASTVKYGVMMFSHTISNWGDPGMDSPNIKRGASP